jgi:dTDP-N-acetylfucosamine:lipid II N-acetylfucosaminyltransferase
MPKILHISRDNNFLDFAINCFEQVNEGSNYYLVISDDSEISHIRYKEIQPLSLAEAKKLVSETGFLKEYKAVIFHGISPVEKSLMDRVGDDIKVIWFGYGYDYYPLLDFFMLNYLGKKTKKIWYLNKGRVKSIGLKINEVFPFWTNFKSRKKLEEFSRVDYFAPVLEQEYLSIKSKHPQFKAKYLNWNYEVGYKVFDSIGDEYVNGTNFLVGNSASMTNNHLDVFDLLTPEKVGDRQVVVPLSYGFPKYYKKHVEEAGSQLFKSRFRPLDTFMPFEEYLQLLRSCGFALFGSIRQQALGNIYMTLALGVKVYLDKRNPVLQELRSKGFVIFDFDDFKKENSFSEPLAIPFQQHNRELMRQMSLKENYLQKTRSLLNLVDTF